MESSTIFIIINLLIIINSYINLEIDYNFYKDKDLPTKHQFRSKLFYNSIFFLIVLITWALVFYLSEPDTISAFWKYAILLVFIFGPNIISQLTLKYTSKLFSCQNNGNKGKKIVVFNYAILYIVSIAIYFIINNFYNLIVF